MCFSEFTLSDEDVVYVWYKMLHLFGNMNCLENPRAHHCGMQTIARLVGLFTAVGISQTTIQFGQDASRTTFPIEKKKKTGYSTPPIVPKRPLSSSSFHSLAASLKSLVEGSGGERETVDSNHSIAPLDNSHSSASRLKSSRPNSAKFVFPATASDTEETKYNAGGNTSPVNTTTIVGEDRPGRQVDCHWAPDVNNILSLFGTWLFDGASNCNNCFQSGRAEALATLSRLFCNRRIQNEIKPVYLQCFYAAVAGAMRFDKDKL